MRTEEREARNRVSSSNEELAELRRRITDYTRTAKRLNKEASDLEGEIERRRTTLAEAKKFEGIRSVLDRLGVKDLEQAGRILSDLEKLGSATAAVQLIQQHGSLSAAIEAGGKTPAEHSAKVTELQNTVASLQKQREAIESSVKTCSSRLDELRDQLTRRQGELEQFRKEIVAEEKQKRKELDEAMNRLRAERLSEISKEGDLARQQEDKKIQTLKDDIARLERNLKELREEKTGAEIALKGLGKKKTDLEQEVKEATTKLEEIKSVVANYRPLAQLANPLVNPSEVDTPTIVRYLDAYLEAALNNFKSRIKGRLATYPLSSNEIKSARAKLRNYLNNHY